MLGYEMITLGEDEDVRIGIIERFSKSIDITSLFRKAQTSCIRRDYRMGLKELVSLRFTCNGLPLRRKFKRGCLFCRPS